MSKELKQFEELVEQFNRSAITADDFDRLISEILIQACDTNLETWSLFLACRTVPRPLKINALHLFLLNVVVMTDTMKGFLS